MGGGREADEKKNIRNYSFLILIITQSAILSIKLNKAVSTKCHG